MIEHETLIPGERYETTAPDTLDLAERAELAVNAMAGALNEARDYEYFWLTFYAQPFEEPSPWHCGNGLIQHHAGEWTDSNGRAAEAFLLLRLMTGSDRFLDREHKMLESWLARVGDDGLLYNPPYRDDAPWRKGGPAGCRAKEWRTDDDIAFNANSIHVLLLMIFRYLKDGDPEAYRLGEKVARGLMDIAIIKDDYAYYPATGECGADFAYFRKTGWADTREAASDMDCPEGAVLAYMGLYVHALSRWYAVSGDQSVLELVRRLVRYMLKPQFWAGNLESWAKGMDAEVFQSHGGLQRKPAALFKAHISGMAYAFQGLIEYALIDNDAYVKEWVRQGYECMRNLGLVRIGMWGENVANNIFAAVAIKLMDAGLGDYWEDVDQYVRNSVVEDQFIDAELLKAERRKRGFPENDPEYPVERFLGNLRWCGLIDRRGTLDPTQNGVMSAGPYLEPFYYIWESITRYQPEQRAGQVNLLLNRASAWLDIDSYLPYEGKVVIHNKTCRSLSIHIPAWVDRAALACSVDGLAGEFFWTGNFIVLSNLRGTETVTLQFPMVESTETYYLQFWDIEEPWYSRMEELPKYILHLRGNTCVGVVFPNREQFLQGWVTPGANGESGYPVYQREDMRQGKAPMKTVTRYIAPKLVAW